MVFHLVADESYTSYADDFVIAGYIATPEAWASFTVDWEALLPAYGTISKSGRPHFKMSEMTSPSHLGNVQRFYDVIERTAAFAFSIVIGKQVMARARSRISLLDGGVLKPFPKMGDALHPYRFAWWGIVQMLQRNPAAQNLLKAEPLKIIFDLEESHVDAILKAWLKSREKMSPEDLAKFVGDPSFEKDEDCVALQAADFWAWWSRRWHQEGVFHERMTDLNAGAWSGEAHRYPRFAISYDEETMTRIILDAARNDNPHLVILDTGSAA